MHNLGVVSASGGQVDAAIVWFDRAIATDPGYAMAYFNRAMALIRLGRRREAMADLIRASSFDPDNYASHRELGFLLLAEGQRGRALDHFARTYELRRGEERGGIAQQSLNRTNRCKLRHDAEQFRYLAEIGRERPRFTALARAYDTLEKGLAPGIVALSSADLEIIGESYNTAINLAEAPEIATGTLNDRLDKAGLLADYRSKRVAVFDEFLTIPAFASLAAYLLGSTIWHDFGHIDGFVASYLEDGLACPLLLQIADELRQALPELLGDNPLSQAWAFKAVAPKAKVEIHSDDGAVSVNFWLTPTKASRSDADRGGMCLCLTPPPADWTVRDYDLDKTRATRFLSGHAHDVEIVPYRENRAVFFDSCLLHWSDSPEFAASYENHRINVTLLFGRKD